MTLRQRLQSKKFRTFFVTVNLILVLIISAAAYYAVTLYTKAQSCYTRQQVTDDTRCLYIYKTGVYEKGTRSSPHHGNACGTDITAIIPDSHLLDKVGHLDPNYKGELCSDTPVQPTTAPTSTPTATPQPSDTPAPTATPVPTVVIQPTSAPTTVPQQATTQPSNTPAPTATRAPSNQVVIAPTATTIPTATPTPTAALVAIATTPGSSTATQAPSPTNSTSVTPLPVAGDSHWINSSAIVAIPLLMIGALLLLF